MRSHALATALTYDPRCLLHDAGSWHPERPERLVAVLSAIEDYFGPVTFATPAAPDRAALESVHDPAYLTFLERFCAAGGGHLNADTFVGPASYEAAVVAAGSACRAVDDVIAEAASSAFALVRPPGHHALRARAMGFCLLNHVAIAARYAQHRHRVRRVLIVDWDVHHGNGTHDGFYEDPDVSYFSVHRWPFFYPGSGAVEERGRREGLGSTCNVPLGAGAGDADYLAAFQRVLAPFARKMAPELILVSAGYDAHVDDPLGGMKLTEAGYAALTATLVSLAQELCPGRLAFVLEGGYDVEALGSSVVATLAVLAGESTIPPTRSEPKQATLAVIDAARRLHGLP